MATAQFTITRIGTGAQMAIKVTWAALTQADAIGRDLSHEDIPDIGFFSDWTWHATGTWNGATVSVQGSNNDSVYGDLTNGFTGAAISWTADGSPKTQGERPLYVRPAATSAGASTSVVCVLVMRRNMGVF